MNFFRSKRAKPANESSSAAAAAAASATTNSDQSGNGLSIEYFQIQFLLDCLMRVAYDSNSHTELIAMCFEQFNDNQNDMKMLNEFRENYTPNRALWWYLQDCFLYKILNYSLESQDIRNLFIFRGILRDIKQQMQQHKSSKPLEVYRSQLMPLGLFDKWISSVGQCVAVNSFLSATTNQEIALAFLNNSQITKENHERVLLVINADPHVPGSKPFVEINSLNYSGDKYEVLFMFGSIFLIDNITCGDDNVYRIELTLYSDMDHEFKPIFDDMKKKYGNGDLNLLTFSQILYDLDRFEEAEEYTNRYLGEIPPDHADTLRCYDMLGSIALAKTDFEASLKWYNKALEYRMRKPPTRDSGIPDTHEHIGDVYLKQGLYDLAIKHYKTSLEIKSTTFPAQHPTIALTLENLGRIYETKKDFRQAIAYFQEALTIYRGFSSLQDKVTQIEEHIRRISHSFR